MANTIKSLVGTQVGSLIAKAPTNERENRNVVWEWECMYCGHIIKGTEIQINRSKGNPSGKFHCKCTESTKDILNGRAKDIKGTKVGTLVAVAPTIDRYEPQGSIVWSWRCLNCGNVINGTLRQIKRSKNAGKYRCKCIS